MARRVLRLAVIAVAIPATLVLALAGCKSADDAPPPPPPIRSTSTPAGSAVVHPSGTAVTPVRRSGLRRLTADVQVPNGSLWLRGNLYTACSGDGTIYEIDTATGETAPYVHGVGDAHDIYGELSDGQASLWIPDFADNSLKHIIGSEVTTIADGLDGPWGIAYLSEDEFLVTNALDGTVRTVSRTGDIEVVLSGLDTPTGIAVDAGTDGVYVANNDNAGRSIVWFGAGEVAGETNSATVRVLVSGLDGVTDVLIASDGGLYFSFAEGDKGVVGRIDPQYCRLAPGCSADDVEILVAAGLEAPLAGLTLADDMRLFVHTAYSRELFWAQIDD